LIIAGGYDERVSENKLYFEQLLALCDRLQLKYQCVDPSMLKASKCQSNGLFLDNDFIQKQKSVYFVMKFPDCWKIELLRECSAVLYTPPNEHFGIVPLEAMLALRPVIAQKSGGPLETIIDGKTGFLCKHDEAEWAKAMAKFVNVRALTAKMGKQGRQRVVDCFSRSSLEKTMQRIKK